MTEIVSFGEATLRLRAPRGRQLTRTERFDAAAGGPECNTAVAASELGADAVWLSRLPDSPLGRRVVAELRSHGVRTGVSWGNGDEKLATAFVDAGAAPRGRTEIYHDHESAFTSVRAGNLPLGSRPGCDVLLPDRHDAGTLEAGSRGDENPARNGRRGRYYRLLRPSLPGAGLVPRGGSLSL
jgi:Sugar kinases, ribokinase family